MSASRARLRPSREATRQRVLDGAAQAFAERGFHGASLDDICARAGLTRGAFHSSFASKEDLFFALYDRMVEQVRERLAVALDAVLAAEGPAVEIFAALFFRDFPADRSWFLLNAEFTLYAIRQPSAAPRLAEHRQRMRDAISATFDALLARAGRTSAIDGDKVARMVLAISDGGLGQSLVEPDRLGPTELLVVALAPLFAAVSAPAEPARAAPGEGARA